MSAPPDLNHAWRLDQHGRWYYLDRQNRPIYHHVDQAAPRYPGVVPRDILNTPNTLLGGPPPSPQYATAPQNSPGQERAPFVAQNAPQQAAGQHRNALIRQPVGQGASQPIPIPANAARPVPGQGRGNLGAGGPQSPPATGFAQSPGAGGGRGQPAMGGPLPQGNPQGLVGGRGRAVQGAGRPPLPLAQPNNPPGRGRGTPRAGGPQPLAAGNAQQSGAPAPLQPGNAQTLVLGRGRGNALGGVLPTQQSPGGTNVQPPPNPLPPPQQTNTTNAQPPPGTQPPQQTVVVTNEQRDTLNADYKVRRQPRNFFRLGKVFLSLHTESYGGQSRGRPRQSTFNTPNADVFVVAFGELVFTKVRRFIVVREDLESCSALAITTHSGRGAAQRNASEHGVVYTGASAPPSRFRNENGILPTAIRIDPFDEDDTLHVASRVNYGKLYNIEHNVKVKPYGVVNNQFMHALITQWTQVFIGRTGNLAQLAFRTPSQSNLQDLGFTPSQITNVTKMLAMRGAIPYNVITSLARASAELQLTVKDRPESVVKRLANHVVDLILAGMTYPNAVSHVKLMRANELADDDDDDDNDDADAIG